MSVKRVVVTMSIDPHDDTTLERLAGYNAHELMQLDSVAVQRPHDTAVPDGAKGVGSDISTLVLTLSAPALLGSVQILRTWIARDLGREVTVKDGDRELHLKGMNSEQHERLVREFLDAGQAGPDNPR
jgi:hypothetical protein